VAMKFASLYPQRLIKLVVVDIAPRYYDPHHQQIIAGLKAVDLETMSSRTEADSAMAAFIPEPDVRQFLLKNLYRDESGKFAWRINLPVLETAVGQIGEALSPEARITTPTLFIRGENSRYISDRDIAEIPGRFSDSRIVTIAGAGHWVQAEQPETFARAVLNFLS
jgi:esterase